MDDIEDKVIALVKTYSAVETVNIEDELINDLGYNSFNFLQLIIQLEKSFHIEFIDEFLLMSELSTVRKICNTVVHLMEGGGKNE